MPALINKKVATGISKAIPKAKISFIMKFKYSLISVITIIDSGATPIKNLKIIGQTTKYAKATPDENNNIVEIINGAINDFSFL